MTKSFLTATAFAALIGFGASTAVAQQSAPPLEAPAIEKSVPAESGKAASDQAGTLRNKSGTSAQQDSTAPADKAKRDAAVAKRADSRAKRQAAKACAGVTDKSAHEACVTSHLKNQTAKTPSTKTAPDNNTVAPRTGG